MLHDIELPEQVVHFSKNVPGLKDGWREKGKERKSIYIAPFCTKVHSKRSGVDHTFAMPIHTIIR